jgi:hypothetical protein
LLGCGSLPESEWDHANGYKQDQVKAPRNMRSNHGVDSASIEAVCRKTRRDVNALLGQKPVSQNSVKNYMSDKIGDADSGIITIDQPAGLARENII